MQDMREGIKSMTLQASEGRIYDPQHYADLDAPFVTFYKAGKISSTMRAPTGKVFTETHVIEAWGGVTVITTDSTTLTTERLEYDPQKRKIFTKEAVRLDKPDSVTEGVGLEADPGLESVKISQQTVHVKKNKGTKPPS
jgi:LPS export ABC transporter protein LptC